MIESRPLWSKVTYILNPFVIGGPLNSVQFIILRYRSLVVSGVLVAIAVAVVSHFRTCNLNSRAIIIHILFCPRVIGGRILPCLLTGALSSDVTLIISRWPPWFWRDAPSGSKAACMLTAMLDARHGWDAREWSDIVRWSALAVIPAMLEGMGGRVTPCSPSKDKRFSVSMEWDVLSVEA